MYCFHVISPIITSIKIILKKVAYKFRVSGNKASKVGVLLRAWYLKNVRPATKLSFERYSVGLRNYSFETVDTRCCLVKINCSLLIRQATLLAIPMLCAVFSHFLSLGLLIFLPFLSMYNQLLLVQ